MQTLTVNDGESPGHPVTIGDQCLWLKWIKTPVQENKPVGGLWEPRATFDIQSPAFYYVIIGQCFKIGVCQDDVKAYVSQLRDEVGNLPLQLIYTGTSTITTFEVCLWAETPEASDDQKRYEEFLVKFESYNEPLVVPIV